MFDSLQDRLQSAFKNLRGKGRLSEADIDATLQEIRVGLGGDSDLRQGTRGSIAVEDTPGGGATFVVSLPNGPHA